MSSALERTEIPTGAPTECRGVPPVVALVTLVVLAVVVLLAEWLLHVLEIDAGGNTDELGWWDVASSILEHALIVLGALVPVRLVWGRLRAADFGLLSVPWRSAISSAVITYGTYLVFTTLLFAIVGAPPERNSATALAASDSADVLAVYALIACVLAPPTEELLFRGFLFSSLRRRLPVGPAALVAGFLFGALHGPPLGSMLDLALLGIALCVLYARTGSLLPCVGVHAVHNAIAFGIVVSLPPLATIALTVVAAPLAVAVAWALGATIRGEARVKTA